MRKGYRARARPLLVAALATAATVGSAAAQSVYFEGYTEGCFFTTGTAAPYCSAGSSASLGKLFFTGTNFSGTTTNGLLSNVVLGSFLLQNGYNPYTYTGSSFKLLVTFIDPTNGHQNLFTAALTGTIYATSGYLDVDFNNSLQQWSDANGLYGMEVPNDMRLVADQTYSLTGDLHGTTVPEPLSLVLLGSGLLGVGAVRRRRSKDEQV